MGDFLPANPLTLEIACHPAMSDCNGSSRMTDPEHARRVFKESGDWVGSVGNFDVTGKRGPYSLRDFMVMYMGNGGGDVSSLIDLPQDDFEKLFSMLEYFRNMLNRMFVDSDFVLGLNSGPSQSIKRLHIHCTDRSFFTSLNGDGAGLMERLNINASSVNATKVLRETLADVLPDLDFVDMEYPLGVRLKHSIFNNVGLIKKIVGMVEEYKKLLNLKFAGGEELFGYGMTIDGDDVLSLGMVEGRVGLNEMSGITVDRRPGEFDEDYLAHRRGLLAVLGSMLSAVRI
ncbi:hypothetical protein HOF67_01995 [Candidatus Peregrinibacteria bacterium]|mgnify:CR=1 FL=1|jgi:hypothetical protein|nr:hypothetical protein [Candidatus Peregrinibacteria bacterium]